MPGAAAGARASAWACSAAPSSAARSPRNPYRYGPGYYGPGYGYGPGYYAGGPYGPCYWQRQRFWDGYGWRARNVRVCE